MAFIFADGFDSYAAASEWGNKGMVNGSLNLGTAGRFGGNCVNITYNSVTPSYSASPIVASGDTLYAGFWWQSPAAGTPGFPVIAYNGGDIVRASASSGFMTGWLNGAQVAVGTVNITDANWHWIEVSLLLNGAASTVVGYVDGVEQFTFTGTGPAGSGIGTLTWNAGGFNGGYDNSLIDDVIIWDNTGTTFNTFPLGPRRITCLNPAGAGDSTGFTSSNGAANYTCVADSYTTGTYVSATGTTDTDLYTLSSLPYQPTDINAVVLSVYGQNPGTGTRTLQPMIKTNGATSMGVSFTLPNGVNSLVHDVFTADPAGNPWSYASVASAQIGFVD